MSNLEYNQISETPNQETGHTIHISRLNGYATWKFINEVLMGQKGREAMGKTPQEERWYLPTL